MGEYVPVVECPHCHGTSTADSPCTWCVGHSAGFWDGKLRGVVDERRRHAPLRRLWALISSDPDALDEDLASIVFDAGLWEESFDHDDTIQGPCRSVILTSLGRELLDE